MEPLRVLLRKSVKLFAQQNVLGLDIGVDERDVGLVVGVLHHCSDELL